LKRAKETASILAETINCPIKLEDDLMEFNNGALAGLTFEEGKRYPIPKTMHDRVEKGESSIEFRMRVESIFSQILHNQGYNRIAIVAHGGVINNLMRSFYKMPVTREFSFKSGDTAIHYLEIKEDERIVHFLNDVSHLQHLQ
jgi:2,3-bisphosphoglycerate-dependent phosphoglycerate mutase